MKEENDNPSRRKVLKKTGSLAVAMGSLPAIGSARNDKSERRNLYERSLFLRDKHDWNVNEWRQYLYKHGSRFKWQDARIAFETPNSDEASTEHLNRKFLDLSVTYNTGYYYSDNLPRIDVDWEFNITDDYPNAWGEDPADMVEVKWGEDYILEDGSQYYGSDCQDPSYRGVDSKGSGGFVAEYDSYAATYQYSYNDFPFTVSSYCGSALNNTSTPSDECSFDIDYKCFYENVNLDWSYSSDGIITVNPETETKSWVANFIETEDNLYDTKTKDFESQPGT